MEPSSGIKTINGLAILDDEIFVVSERCSNIDVYFYEDFSYSRQLTLKELIAAVDLVSCNRNKWLYVMDKKTTGKSKEILKVMATIVNWYQHVTFEEFNSIILRLLLHKL